jgi:Holliday junction resolvase RusA-like endonuclease
MDGGPGTNLFSQLRSEEPMDSFVVTLHGQPVSTNHMYMLARGAHRIVKAPDVERYQANVTMQMRAAKPSAWKPPQRGWIRIAYAFYLSSDIDCDNAMKALNDAIALALGVNDKKFLPCVNCKHIGMKPGQERVDVLVMNVAQDACGHV